jgi:hypothetical protein
MPADAPLTYTFNVEQKYAQVLNTQKAHGHDHWRVPTSAELNMLFDNRAAIGGFDIGGSYPTGSYWSSTQDGKCHAWTNGSATELRSTTSLRSIPCLCGASGKARPDPPPLAVEPRFDRFERSPRYRVFVAPIERCEPGYPSLPNQVADAIVPSPHSFSVPMRREEPIEWRIRH